MAALACDPGHDLLLWESVLGFFLTQFFCKSVAHIQAVRILPLGWSMSGFAPFHGREGAPPCQSLNTFR